MAQITFRMQLEGKDRKDIAETMALAVETVAKYEGPPNFTYEAFGWRVDRDGVLCSPDMDDGRLAQAASIAAALRDAGISARGTMIVYVFGLPQHVTVNISNILRSKASLMQQAFQCDQDEPFERGEHAVRLAFLPATLDPDTLLAYLLFVIKLVHLASKLTRVTAKERDTSNFRYAFRCFLLRLGFIGDEYKQARKLLLQHLDGDGSWRDVRPNARSTQCASESCKTHNYSPE